MLRILLCACAYDDYYLGGLEAITVVIFNDERSIGCGTKLCQQRKRANYGIHDYCDWVTNMDGKLLIYLLMGVNGLNELNGLIIFEFI